MNREDIIRLAIEHTIHGLKFDEDGLVRFANLVAEYERTKLQGQIETLYSMYELASKQRDYLMEQQNAQVAAMRGKMQ
jgi:hypothetical protein